MNVVYPGATVFESDFEGNLQGWKNSDFNHPASAIVSTPNQTERTGEHSLKFRLEKPDKREELSLNSVPLHSEYTYRFSTFLSENYAADPTWEIIAQWHGRKDKELGEIGRPPPLALMTQAGKFHVHRRWDPNQVTNGKDLGPGGGQETVDLGAYQTNRWTDWVFHVKWSYGDDGLVEVWRDEELVLRETGPNTYNDREGPYLKIGIYKPNATNWQNAKVTQRELLYDDVTISQVESEDRYLLGGQDNDFLIGLSGDNTLTGGGGQDQFLIAAGGGTDIITDFGGVGASNSSPMVLEQVDTLRFLGEGAIAENMLLDQEGENLKITFEGVANTKVILQNFDLEDLENLATVGNILFDGQKQIQDSFDVFNQNQENKRVFNRNTVTFLNDLDNYTKGYNASDDIINGQGGDDTLSGLSGGDLLRGGAGDDVLYGGSGNDILVGSSGYDTLYGGQGADQFWLTHAQEEDLIADFKQEEDSFLLAEGLEFEQLEITASNNQTLIREASSGELLAYLNGVQSSLIGWEDLFVAAG